MVISRDNGKFLQKKFLFVTIALLFHFLVLNFYIYSVTPYFGYAGMIFSEERLQEVSLLVISSLCLVLISVPNKVKPSNLFVLVLYVFVMNSILTAAIHSNKIDQVLQYIPSLTISMLIISFLSKFEIKINIKGSQLFEYIVLIFFIICFLSMIYQAQYSGLHLAELEQIYSFRENLNISTFTRYGISIFTFAIGPLMIAISLRRKQYLWMLASFCTYLIAYMLIFQKSTLLAPLWVTGIYFLIGKNNISNTKLLLYLASPFFIAFLFSIFSSSSHATVSAIFGTRMYIVPGQVFSHYVELFTHFPHTYFSHIKIISSFIEYPYDLELPVLIKAYFIGGNQNANFFAQDAVAGAGIWAMPVIGIIFAIVIVIVNTVTRGLDLRFALMACAMAAQRFSDGSLATGLLSGGVVLLIILLAIAPREHYGPSEAVEQPS